MKKLYTTLALAAAATLGISAQSLSLGTTVGTFATLKKTAETTAVATMPASKVMAPAQAPTAESVYGVYDWEYTQFMVENEGDAPAKETSTLTLSAGTEANKVSIMLEGLDVTADLDLAKSTISIPVQDLGQANVGSQLKPVIVNVKFIHKVYNGNAIVDSNTPVSVSITDNSLTFSQTDLFGLAGVDPSTSKVIGYFTLCGLNSATKQGGNEDPDDRNWESIGVASFDNGIIASMYDTTSATYDCKVSRSGNLLRLENAFSAYDSTPTNLIFDITDPKNVIIEYSKAIAKTGDGVLYVCSQSWLANENNQGDKLEAKYKVTLDGLVINIPKNAVMFNWPDAEYNPNDPDSTDPEAFYTVHDKYALASKVTLPEAFNGVEGVEIDTVGGPAEYFNLQGVRVAEPSAGLYIRRAGNKVEKVYVK